MNDKFDEELENIIKKEEKESTILIKWVSSYDTGHKVIDEQHKELVNIINNLYAVMLDDTANKKNALLEAIKKCIDYTNFHFSEEEKIMDSTNYSKKDDHKSMHRQFVLQLIEHIKGFETWEPYSVYKFIHYLKDWLLEHIAYQDKIFISEIKKNYTGK